MSKKFTHATEGAERALTAKQAAFVREYLIDLNATQAAIRAGYSAKTANEQGSRLLANASVAQAVQAGMDKRAEKVGLSAEQVLENIKRIGQKAEDEGEFNAALKAQELYGKHLKLFTDRVEQSGSLTIQVSTGVPAASK